MKVLMPANLPEALGLLASDGAAIPIAGGTDLLVHWPIRGEAHDRTYVDLSRLDPLKALGWTADELMLGGLTTYWDVIRDGRAREEFPLLVHAARQVGAIQIQARGTWAGNIVNGSPAADGWPTTRWWCSSHGVAGRKSRWTGSIPATKRCSAVRTSWW